MAWLTKTKPHFKIVYSCGKVLAECACSPTPHGSPPKRYWMVEAMCPECEAAAAGRPRWRTYIQAHPVHKHRNHRER
jgi:hypothetical protein